MCQTAPVAASRQKWRVHALVATTRGGRAWASRVNETGQQGRCCWSVDSLQLSQSGRAATSLSSAARSFVDAVGGRDQTAARGPSSSRAIRRRTDGCAGVVGHPCGGTRESAARVTGARSGASGRSSATRGSFRSGLETAERGD
jgi:hypothetical protein